MLLFCQEIENDPKLRKTYHGKVAQLAKWYTDAVHTYEGMLRSELGISKMAQQLQDSTVIRDILEDLSEDLTFAFNAKLSYFCVADALVKLILSKYSLGPVKAFMQAHRLTCKIENNPSWLEYKCNEIIMVEIVTKVLRDECQEFSIDFLALATDREARSKLAHTSSSAPCLSAMRSYNVIRSMFAFLDPDYNDLLPAFSFGDMFCYDEFLAEPCFFNFDDCTTILVADSVHDVRGDYRSAVANLPWDLVIDLDGYSDAGGLLSCVNHNRIQSEVLYRSPVNTLLQFPVGKTLWYRCGEYQSFSFIPNNDKNCFTIAPYSYFHKDARGTKPVNNLKAILQQLLKLAQGQDRPISIVAVTDNSFFIKQLISSINAPGVELDDYFLSWIGLTDKENLILDWFDEEAAINAEHFRHQQCPTYQFYKAFAEHSQSWSPRLSLESNFTLPGSDGPVALRELERNNLVNYFDVLYDHCEQEPPERSEALRLEFYRGNMASWNTIANEYTLRLWKPSVFERMKQTIRTVLGFTQQMAQKRLFFIQHAAGIGGSTIARQLAWDLHSEYAVLSVQNYISNTIKTQIEHLYDAVLNKAPIIILADDSLPSFKNLCDDICQLDRRCVLIAACRQSSAIFKAYPQANFETFTSLQDSAINLLQRRYRSVSPLSDTLLAKKDHDFASMVTGQMLTPFIIGLYYIEEKFSIDAYVQKALIGCTERQYADMLACIAICDRYNCKNIPVSFVKRALNLASRADFLRIVPDAASLIISERQGSNIDCYHFKHALLSKRFLELYCKEYYGGVDNFQNALYEQSFHLIDEMAAMGSNLLEIHLNVLISVLIQNKKEDSDLSALMLDIAIPESQRLLMQHLAEQFKPLADAILNEDKPDEDRICDRKERQILRVVSHAYAHLGRMYSRMAGNYKKAHEAFASAINYMPDNDPNIFHMAGNALLDKLKNVWKDHQTGPVDAALLDEIKRDVEQACEYFDFASDYGSPEYGYPSKLELLYSYLRFIFRIFGIHSIQDIPKMGHDLRQLQAKFMDVLEEAKAYPNFDDLARERISDYESRFRSQIMFNNFSKAVEYYQNQVDRLSGTSDIVGLNNALRGMVFARINSARATAPDAPFYRTIRNPIKLIEDIETLLNQPSDPNRYSDYTLRTQLFHYWMQLAKFLGISIESGLAMAKRWLGMEARNKQNKNPEPFYYVRVLLYLSMYAGSSLAEGELHELCGEISLLDANGLFDVRRGSLLKNRDVFIKGQEMGQLFDVLHCRTEEAVRQDLAETKKCPAAISGHFERSLYKDAIIELYDPSCWNGEEAWMDISKKSQSPFTAAQTGHNLRFVMGFCVKHLVILSISAVDLSEGETFSEDQFLSKAKQPKPHPVSATNKLPTRIIQATTETAEPHVPNGTVVEVTLSTEDSDIVSGRFSYGGSTFQVILKFKNKTGRRKARAAQKQKQPIRVRITGQAQAKTYSGQPV